MRKSLFFVLFFLACLACQNAEAKIKQKPVYMFGFATSFVDSVAYITDVQYIDSSFIDTKTKFLVGRNMYSLQLQEFLAKNEGCEHPVTAVFFGTKKEKIEKKMLSVRRRYEMDFKLKNVSCSFRAEKYDEEEIVQSSDASGAKSKSNRKSKK